MSDHLNPQWEGTLLPAIIQDAHTGAVLMLAWMNREAFERTRSSGETWLWSRSRQTLWRKGATSGHTQRVVDVRVDCDADAVLVQVVANGPACHTGATSCFFRSADGNAGDLGLPVLAELEHVISRRAAEMPEGSYTAALLRGGAKAAGAKVTEEAEEVVRATVGESDERIAEEAADLLYHLLVLLRVRGIGVSRPLEVLRRRHAARATDP